MAGERPRIGVGVLILRDGKVLFGLRKSAHGIGTWSPPGGHLEFGERLFACAEREAMEECGLALTHMRQGPITEDLFADRHYVTHYVIAQGVGEPEVKEPDKLERWAWFAWHDLPEPLFLPIANLLAEGYDPYRDTETRE